MPRPSPLLLCSILSLALSAQLAVAAPKHDKHGGGHDGEDGQSGKAPPREGDRHGILPDCRTSFVAAVPRRHRAPRRHIRKMPF